MRRCIALLVTAAMAVQATSCGFLIYPERKGQRSGTIDPGVAILDAAGLFVFIVPGLVAFGVDFVTGCIYMPGGRRRAGNDVEPLDRAYLDPKKMNLASIEDAVQRATGKPVDLRSDAVRAVAVADIEELEAAIATPL